MAIAKYHPPSGVVAKVAAKTTGATLRRVAGSVVPVAARVADSVVPVAARARRLPIQRSIDVAVPVDIAWDQWMRFEFLPEGTHRVADVERDDDDHLVGRVRGLHVERDWEADIVDERIDESFAWHSFGASDCSGLVTFHELSDRLTRLELHLDVIPGGVSDTVALMLHVADRRAESELRRFKAQVEALDPDEYPPPENENENENENQDQDEDR